ncbi:gas vesicle protein GvpL [Haloprofundus salilacus]|uniref:gas vesicle protein GvpL n=1 Tax=Haloprofundus salilacus TaxID=2876190 RepID=UPI001CCD582A|nr:GvpL/GvpF family gas vesicle protein [Haloprofundus salilacus]
MSAPTAEPGTNVDDGRYVYCVVGVNEDDDESEWRESNGVDGAEAYLVAADGVGAVVHRCEATPNPSDLSAVKQSLLRHQHVVDAAGEAFGTPLPLRFGTVVEGGDASVERWLAETVETQRQYLNAFSGKWEYRIEVGWDEDALTETVQASDEKLGELAETLESSSEGTSFLVQKQYDKRLSELVYAEREERVAALAERLDPLVDEMEELGRPSVSLDDAGDSEGGPSFRVAVLAPEENEIPIGDVLDDVEADPATTEVQYTGPWPPYTFAPSLDDEEGTDDGDGRTTDAGDEARTTDGDAEAPDAGNAGGRSR